MPSEARWRNFDSFAGTKLPVYLTEDGRPAASLERGPSDARVMIISMAKAGTYFVGAMLREMGFVDTHLHLWETGLHDYRWKTIEQMVRDYTKFEIRIDIDHSSRLILPGQFAVGHLKFVRPARRATENFRRLFVVRDLRDCLISLMRWFALDGRGVNLSTGWRLIENKKEKMAAFLETAGRRIIQRLFYAPLVGWAFEPHTLRVDYEVLVGDHGVARQSDLLVRLADHIGARFPGCAASFVDTIKGIPTKTSTGERSDRASYWSEAAEHWFIAHGGNAVQRFLDARPIHDDLKPIEPIVGTWRWFNGGTVSIGADAMIRSAQTAVGEVKPLADGGFVFLWHGGHSADLLYPADRTLLGLYGVNNVGHKILVVRTELPASNLSR
jgi:hypothetical protein